MSGFTVNLVASERNENDAVVSFLALHDIK